MDTNYTTAQLVARVTTFRRNAWLLLGIPLLVSSFAYSAGSTRGIVLGLLFLVPLAIYAPIWWRLRDPTQFRPSIPAGLVLATVVLTALAFVSILLAYLSPSDPPFWRLLFLQATLIGAGFLAGLIKHDPKALQKNQRARHKILPGRVLVMKRPSEIYGFRQATGSLLFDWGARVVYAIYVAVIMIGASFGGAAPIVLLRLIGPQPGLGLDAHASGMTLMGLLTLPFLGYVLPALYRSWVGLKQIERTAGHPDTEVVYSWEA